MAKLYAVQTQRCDGVPARYAHDTTQSVCTPLLSTASSCFRDRIVYDCKLIAPGPHCLALSEASQASYL